tara:strand:+ start:363 stop:563 length:201 start_codon:yes stop_codon:yes gene_type:complete
MNWVILITLYAGDPFVIPYKTFEYKKDCTEYVTDASNASTLAVEVISVAGFNDPVIDISCVIRREG